MAIAGTAQQPLREFHQVGRQIIVGQVETAAGLAAREHRAGLDDQVVDREVGRPFGDRPAQLLAPVVEGLGRQGLDQIEAPAAQAAVSAGSAQPVAGLEQIGSPMPPAEGGQHGVIEALPPQAHPVDAGGQITRQPRLIEAGRIHLQADLRPWGQSVAPPQRRQQRRHLGGGEHRGRAAAEVDGGEWRTRRRDRDLRVQQLQVGRDRGGTTAARPIGPIPQGHHGEIAVKTSPVAEGDVQVGRPRGRHHGR